MSAPFIDPATGTVRVKGRRLTAGLTAVEFLKLGLGETFLMQSDPWATFRVEASDSHGAPFTLVLRFNEERLREIEFFAVEAPEGDLEQTAKLYDAWLIQELGKGPYQYAWGQVWATLDRKAETASAVLIYGDRLF